MVLHSFARYKADEIIDIDKVDALLTIKNPEYAPKARFGNRFMTLPDEYLNYCYEDGDEILVPRNFADIHPELFKQVIAKDNLCSGKPLLKNAKFTAAFTGSRAYQQDYIDIVDFDFWDLLYEVPCGHGKTILGLHNIIKRGVSALVLVPTYQIAQQWLTTIQERSENVRGEIANPAKFNKTDFSKIDILILSFDLFDSRKDKLPAGFAMMWGNVLLDEAHLVGAPTYQPVLELIPSKYRLALTATFRRNDGMIQILQYHFGTKYTMENQFAKPNVFGVATGFEFMTVALIASIRGGKKLHEKNKNLFLDWLCKQTDFFWLIHDDKVIELDIEAAIKTAQFAYMDKSYTGEQLTTIRVILKDFKAAEKKGVVTTVDTLVAICFKRNRPLIELTLFALQCGRKVVFVSKRKQILFAYAKLFEAAGYKVGILVGSDKRSRDKDYLKWCTDEADIIFGIYQLAKLGLDIDTLDTLVLHHPVKDIEQPAGRINRDMPGKKQPAIIYPVDEYSPYKHMYQVVPKITRNVVVFPIDTVENIKKKLI